VSIDVLLTPTYNHVVWSSLPFNFVISTVEHISTQGTRLLIM